MKITLTETMFKDAFRDANRQDNFSHEGLSALFDWIEDYETDTGEEWELDVIALCCEFQEDTLEYFQQNYDIDINQDEDFREQVLEYLYDRTVVIEVDENTVIIQNY